MPTSLTPIPTPYAGYYFRSRLEARWATFFDALHLRWRYEPDGYPCNGTGYLPDFLVTNLAVADGGDGEPALWEGAHVTDRVFLEVKPCGYDEGRDAWHRDFGRRSPIGLVVATGMPPGYTCGQGRGYRHDEAGEVRLFTDTGMWRSCQFVQCVRCTVDQWLVTTGQICGCCPTCGGRLDVVCGALDVADAAFEARMARFGIDY